MRSFASEDEARAYGDRFDERSTDVFIASTGAYERLRAAARAVVLASTPFVGALELGHQSDGEELHRELREALGISEEEWRESEQR